MKINIIRTEGSWIIGDITLKYAELLPNCTLHPIGYRGNKGDVNLYITYSSFRGSTEAIDVGWFTHNENKTFDEIANSVDYCIAMSNKTSELLPKHKTTVIEPGISESFIKKPIVFGCVGRAYPSGRKTFNWISELSKIEGVNFLFTNGKVHQKDMPSFYKQIDYLLILSKNEGGPMPVLEAIGTGTPIIAPNVGWSWEYPCIKYNSLEELIDIVQRLSPVKNSWEISANKMFKVLQNLHNHVKK
jgi:hypothetical protein